MPTRTPADIPESFPSVETPTAGPRPAARSYRDLERTLTPLPDSSHRPTDAEVAEAELPRPIEVSGGDGFPSADAVRAAIERLSAIDASDLELAVIGGSVRLSGSVARASDRDRILAAVHAVPGVTEVVDHLRLRLE